MGAFHSTQNFGWGVKWNGPFRFGPTEIFGTSLVKVAHFDRSSHFGRSDRNVPFHLTVPLFCILLTRTITKRAVAWVAVQSECPVPLRTRNFRNFKPELPGVGGGGGTWDSFCRVCVAGLLEPLPIIVYFVANYRPHLSHVWANM